MPGHFRNSSRCCRTFVTSSESCSKRYFLDHIQVQVQGRTLHGTTHWRIILLLSCIGHAELWVIAVNRSHAFRIRAKYLRMFRGLHDLAIVVFPWVLLVNCGLNDHGLLRGGSVFRIRRSSGKPSHRHAAGTIPFFTRNHSLAMGTAFRIPQGRDAEDLQRCRNCPANAESTMCENSLASIEHLAVE